MANMRNIDLEVTRATFKCCFDPLKFCSFSTAGVSGVWFCTMCLWFDQFVFTSLNTVPMV